MSAIALERLAWFVLLGFCIWQAYRQGFNDGVASERRLQFMHAMDAQMKSIEQMKRNGPGFLGVLCGIKQSASESSAQADAEGRE